MCIINITTVSFSGTTLNNGKPAADIRTNNTFTFKKGWAAELNASVNTGGRSGFMVLDPQWGISTGVQKTVLKNKGTVRFKHHRYFLDKSSKSSHHL